LGKKIKNSKETFTTPWKTKTNAIPEWEPPCISQILHISWVGSVGNKDEGGNEGRSRKPKKWRGDCEEEIVNVERGNEDRKDERKEKKITSIVIVK